MAITRTPMIDDDGSGLTGTPINNAWKQELYDQIDAVPASRELFFDLTAAFYNDWRPPNGEQYDTWLLGTNTPGVGITGILNTEGIGAVHYLTSFGGQGITLFHLNAGSAAQNQLLCPGNVNWVLKAGQSVRIYSSAHTGVWIVQAFA